MSVYISYLSHSPAPNYPTMNGLLKVGGGGFKFKHSNEANKSLEIVSLFDLQAAFGIFSTSGFFFFMQNNS